METIALPGRAVPNGGASPMLEVARIRPVTASSCDIQSASAIAGDMRTKACWVGITCR